MIYDGKTVKAWAAGSQWRALRADYARFKQHGYSAWGTEGFWALAIYRMQKMSRAARPSWPLLPVRLALGFAKKILSIVTHINLNAAAEIGPGLLIPHSGPVRVHGDSTIGADCSIYHACTIGAGPRPGGAVVGDHVFMGCGSSILGPVTIGDHAVIAANSLVTNSVPAGCTAIGVPAKILVNAKRDKSAAGPDDGSGATGVEAASSELAFVATAPLVARPVGSAWDHAQVHAAERPGDCAISYRGAGGQWLACSWHQLAGRVKTAMAYLDANLPDQAPVIIFARRTPDCVAMILAALGSGRPFSCVNLKWRWPQIHAILIAAQTSYLFTDDESNKALADLIGAGIADRSVDIVQITQVLAGAGAGSARPGNAARRLPSADRHACFLFTSGSTGAPKGVRVSQLDLAGRAETEAAWFGLKADDVLLGILPYSFNVGLNQLLAAIVAGSQTVLLDSWLPADIIATSVERGVTGIAGVPSIWEEFLSADLAFDTQAEGSRLRFITISGGDLPPRQLSRLPEIAPGVEIFKTYGQTESFRATSLAAEDFAAHCLSVGKPTPGVTVCVVRNDGSIAKRGEVGELVLSGMGVMMGYLGNDSQTAARLRQAPFDSGVPAIFSGDHGLIDADGFIILKGRLDQMVKIKGNRVYPSEVRALLCELPSIRDAIVLVETTAGGGPVILAFVVSAAGANADALRRDMRLSLPSYMMPKHIEVMDALPRTASGKPDAEALRGHAREILAASTAIAASPAALVAEPARALVTERDDIAQSIIGMVRTRANQNYQPSAQPLSDVLDSIDVIDLTLAIGAQFGINFELGALTRDALQSPQTLADAFLQSRSNERLS